MQQKHARNYKKKYVINKVKVCKSVILCKLIHLKAWVVQRNEYSAITFIKVVRNSGYFSILNIAMYI